MRGDLPVRPEPAGKRGQAGEKILLRRKMALGDVVWATALVRALRESFPQAEIYFQTDFPEVLLQNPNLDGTGKLEPPWTPDRVVDLVYETTPLLHLSEAYFNSAGLEFQPRNPELFLSQDEKAWSRRMLSRYHRGTGPLIGLHPGVSWPERTWDWFKWDKLALDLIRDFRARVVVLGRSPDFFPTPWPGLVNLIDRLNLRELMAVVAGLDLLVAIDSGPLHLAPAMGVPAVGLFGCVSPEVRRPFEGVFVPVFKDLDCLGCQQRRPAPSFTAKCETGSYECLRSLSREDVLQGAEKALSASGRSPEPQAQDKDIWMDAPNPEQPLPEWLQLDLGSSGYPNLRVKGSGGAWTHLHSGRDPVAEGLNLVRSIPQERDVVVLGLGLGYHLAALLENPERRGYVLVVEKDADVFRAALRAGVITPHLNDPRLLLIVGLEPGECAWRLKTSPLDRPEALVHRPSFRLNPVYYNVLAEHLSG